MKPYVAGKDNGAHLINVEETWQKIQLAARIIVTVENPEDVIVNLISKISSRSVSQPVLSARELSSSMPNILELFLPVPTDGAPVLWQTRSPENSENPGCCSSLTPVTTLKPLWKPVTSTFPPLLSAVPIHHFNSLISWSPPTTEKPNQLPWFTGSLPEKSSLWEVNSPNVSNF